MKFLSVCSGIEAASVAWNPLGWRAAAFAEIEPFPCSVLAHHYPHVPNRGDMTRFEEWPDDAIDLLCGGTPCQSFSVAGLRRGLSDPRGNLMLTFGAIAAKHRPRWLVWENVPGVLSSNGGRDFGAFLGLLGILGYGFAYRVLDAQYFGVAQRRRRVFVVGCLGDWRSAAAVLFERHSMSGHPAPRRQARERVATTVTAGARKCDHAGSVAGQLIPQAFGGNNTAGPIEVATALNACASASGRMDFESETFIAGTLLGGARARGGYSYDDVPMVAHALRGEGFDASEDGSGRGTPLVPVAVDLRNGALAVNGPTQTIQAAGLGTDRGGNPNAMPHVLAFDCKASGQSGFGIGEVASTMRTMGHANSHQNGGGHQAVAYVPDVAATMVARSSRGGGQTNSPGHQADNEVVAYSTKLHNTASNNAGKIFEERTAGLDANSPPPALLTAMQVRRLVPEECEALQGFPRGYTDVPHRGKPAADGPRYKALGNSWAVPNVRWIGRRIAQVDALRIRAAA